MECASREQWFSDEGECAFVWACCDTVVGGESRKRGWECKILGNVWIIDLGWGKNKIESWGIGVCCEDWVGVWGFITGERYGGGTWRGDKRGLLYCTPGNAQGLMFEFNGHMENGGGVPLSVGTWDCDAEGKGIELHKTGKQWSGVLDICAIFWGAIGFG